MQVHDTYSISGIESFQGTYFHSWEYRNAEGLQGKRVVVIGIGNSGGDIAVDISRVAEQVERHAFLYFNDGNTALY